MPITVNTSRRPASIMRLKMIFSKEPAEEKFMEWAPNEGPTLEMQLNVSDREETKSLPPKHKARVPTMITAK